MSDQRSAVATTFYLYQVSLWSRLRGVTMTPRHTLYKSEQAGLRKLMQAAWRAELNPLHVIEQEFGRCIERNTPRPPGPGQMQLSFYSPAVLGDLYDQMAASRIASERTKVKQLRAGFSSVVGGKVPADVFREHIADQLADPLVRFAYAKQAAARQRALEVFLMSPKVYLDLSPSLVSKQFLSHPRMTPNE